METTCDEKMKEKISSFFSFTVQKRRTVAHLFKRQFPVIFSFKEVSQDSSTMQHKTVKKGYKEVSKRRYKTVGAPLRRSVAAEKKRK